VRTTVPDRDLATRLQQGDEDALREAYRLHAPAVFGLAVRVCNNAPLAEEITQDVFVRLWEQPERFDATRGPLRAYLLAMTHSRAVERVRAEDSMRRRHEAAQREPALSPDNDPSGVVTRNAAREAVRRTLHELPADQRRAIEMAYFEGRSYRDVALALDLPEGTVKYRIRVGMQRMRAALEGMEVSP
jgi:RNA polymerase sigma-70 factor, ECF subfamily